MCLGLGEQCGGVLFPFFFFNSSVGVLGVRNGYF